MEDLQTITREIDHRPVKISKVDSLTVCRLIHAALVDHEFEHKVLTDPLTAIADGYNGEIFPISKDIEAILLSIRASTLSDFADQWLQLGNR